MLHASGSLALFAALPLCPLCRHVIKWLSMSDLTCARQAAFIAGGQRKHGWAGIPDLADWTSRSAEAMTIPHNHHASMSVRGLNKDGRARPIAVGDRSTTDAEHRDWHRCHRLQPALCPPVASDILT